MSSKYNSLYVDFHDHQGSKSPEKKRFLGKFTIIILISLMLFGALGKIYLDRQVTKMSLEWNSIDSQLLVLKKEYENLQMEHEKYMSGAYILGLAREGLNMRPSDPGQIRLISQEVVSKDDSRESLVASN